MLKNLPKDTEPGSQQSEDLDPGLLVPVLHCQTMWFSKLTGIPVNMKVHSNLLEIRLCFFTEAAWGDRKNGFGDSLQRLLALSEPQ